MIMSSPWWCLLALFALLPWVGHWFGLGVNNNRVQKILRSLVFIALALGLARPHLTVENQSVDRVFVVDRSASVEDSAAETLAAKLESYVESDGNTRSHLVFVGNADSSSEKLNELGQFHSTASIAPSQTRGDSPLSAAVARAQAIIPRGGSGSVTIISDGLATRSDDNRAVAALRQKQIPIHVVSLPSKSQPATPVAVHWPAPLRKGTTSRLQVTVASNSGIAGNVALKIGGKTIASGTYSGEPSENVTLEFEPKEAGFVDADLVVVGSDDQAGRSLSTVLPIHDAHQLLYLGDLQKGGDQKLAEMLGPGFEVISADPKDQSAIDAALGKTDLVMLDDLSAEQFPKAVESQLVNSVRSDGLGLVMSGGRASFGAGGWHDRPIETLLPIELVQKEEKRDPSTSLVLVIDTSGSMSGVRVQLAKEVARLAMRRLLPHDKVGIVEFYGAKRWAAPLQPASNAIELQRALNRMDAGGGTVILPALEEAFYGLQNVDTRYKHVLVLTDGGVESGDFESLMRRMSNEGINVSTVLAGGGYHSEFLVNIANWGKGRFYNVPNRFNLPEILLKQPSTTKLPSYRPGVHPVRARGGQGWWGDVDTSAIPELTGYVESKPRPGSEILLETVNEKHPILATWRYGLGRVTTLATEPVGSGTQRWQEWGDYSKALARILERSAADTRDSFRFEVEHDGGEMIIHAIRQRSRQADTADARPIGRIIDSKASEPESLKFEARSPDRFVASIPAPPFGEVIKIETSADNTPKRWQPVIAASPVAAETQVNPSAGIDLAKLAVVSGGESLALNSDWTTGSVSKPTGKRFWSLSSWLFAIALILFLAEIIWRRLPSRQRAYS